MDKRAMKRKVCELDTEYVARIATTMQGLACSRCGGGAPRMGPTTTPGPRQ